MRSGNYEQLVLCHLAPKYKVRTLGTGDSHHRLSGHQHTNDFQQIIPCSVGTYASVESEENQKIQLVCPRFGSLI